MSERRVVRMADLAVLGGDGQLVTHALGSCLGVSVFDPRTGVGGLVHFMLPAPARGQVVPEGSFLYGSSAVPALFRRAYELGAAKERLVVCSAGAAEMIDSGEEVRIGSRNRTLLRKLLWKNSVVLDAEDTGGKEARTMSLSLPDGKVVITKGGVEHVLWSPNQKS